MLVFSAIVPHSPLLLSTIGKKNQPKLKKTLTAFKTIEEDLYLSKAETVIVFSPHGTCLPDAFSINFAKSYKTNLEEFGDFSTKTEFPSDNLLVEHLQSSLRYKDNMPLTMVTEEFLDYGTAVPVCLLTQHLPRVALVPIFHSGLSLEKHFEFGSALLEEIIKTPKRIALIASADLSHRLSDKSPAGYSTEGKKFDEAVVKCLKECKPDDLLKLEDKISEARACGLKTIAMLFGALKTMNCSPELLSYEGPFGIGYLTAKFKLQ